MREESGWLMKSNITLVGLAAMIVVSGLIVKADAGPSNLRAFCATHKNNPGPGEESFAPPEVQAAGATNWRCMDGKVMICYGGASGSACARTERVDVRRRRAFGEFCSHNPGSDYIPSALTSGLSSSWRCNGLRPTLISKVPVDRLGYMKASWRRELAAVELGIGVGASFLKAPL